MDPDPLPAGNYADLPGVRLWYTDFGGSGPPLVLLHANTGNTETWQYNAPAFAAAGYRVVAFDRRGWGRSLAEPASGPQPGSIAGDLDALVDHLRLDHFHLLGIAGGGFAAFDYALWRPERLRSLIVAASIGGVRDQTLAQMMARIRLPEFLALPAQYREVSFSYMATEPEGLQKWLAIHARSQQPGAQPQPLHGEITYAKLAALRIPLLLLAADNDLLAAPCIMRLHAQHLPQAEFILVPGAAHAVNWELPDVFNQHVLAFVGRH